MRKYFLLLWPFIGYFILESLTPPHYVFENLMFSIIVGVISVIVFLLNCKYFTNHRDNYIKRILILLSILIFPGIKSYITIGAISNRHPSRTDALFVTTK